MAFYEMKNGMPVEVDPTDTILDYIDTGDRDIEVLSEDDYPHTTEAGEAGFVDLCTIDPAEWQYW